MLTKPVRPRALDQRPDHSKEEVDKILAILNRAVNQVANNKVVSLVNSQVEVNRAVSLVHQEGAVSLVEDILVVKENLIRKNLKKNAKLKKLNNLSRPNAALSNLCAR